MHKALPHPVQFGSPGIVPGPMYGKQRVHAAVPIANPHARLAAIFILNIKAPAGGTDKCAGAAVYAGKRNIFPKRCVVKFVGVDILQIFSVYKSGYFRFRFLPAGFNLSGGIVGFSRYFPSGGFG